MRGVVSMASRAKRGLEEKLLTALVQDPSYLRHVH